MRISLLKSLAGLSLLWMVSATAAASAQKSPSAAPTPAATGAPLEKVDLVEPSQGFAAAGRFLAQPKLAEAIAIARSDKQAAADATRNPDGFLAKQGVQVPGNVKVSLVSSGGVGAASKVKVEASCSYPPLRCTIVIYF